MGTPADGPSADRAFALAVIGMVLASPIAWHHYFVILLLPLIILWQTCRVVGNE